jgi:O-antigen ligase
VRRLAVPLLVMLLGFVFVSAATAENLGLQVGRSAAFAIAFLALAGLALVNEPGVAAPVDLPALALLALFGAMVAQDWSGPLHPLDLKPVLPVLALLAAPRVALLLRGADLARLVWLVLSAYALAAAVLLALGPQATLLRAVGPAERWDVTGSLVAHGSLSTIHAVLTLSVAGQVRHGWQRAACAACALLSLGMAFLTGTRTVLAILAFYLLLAMCRGGARDRQRLLVWSTAIAAALVAHTALVSDGLLLRLLGTGEDYSSGRWSSLAVWLGRIGAEPFGIGLGGLRETMAGGRPSLGGEELLEWPHNEFVRFTVESGVLGFLFVTGLLAVTLRRAWQAAGTQPRPASDLALGLAADILAESLLQNAFNSIYQATVFLLLIGMLAAARGLPRPTALTPAPTQG